MNLALTSVRDYAGADVTLGTLAVGALVLQTLELPWEPLPEAPCGQPDRSCVPAGTYALVPHDTEAHPRTFALVNPALGVYHEPGDVPADIRIARTACLLHVANYPDELLGCIGLGRDRVHDATVGTWMITLSRNAFSAFQAAVPWTSGHTLTIEYAPGVLPATKEDVP